MTKRRRVLIKISGEQLGNESQSHDKPTLERIAYEIWSAQEMGYQISIVVGGGNLIRGASLAKQGVIGHVTADHMGMLATLANAFAVRDYLLNYLRKVRIFSVCGEFYDATAYSPEEAKKLLEDGYTLIFAGGTGKPGCTTDTAAVSRAQEIEADLVVKATNVDGVYDSDPKRFPEAKFLETITRTEALQNRYGVMDAAAFRLFANRQSLQMRVINMLNKNNIRDAITGFRSVGTLVLNE